MHPWCRCTFVPVYAGSSSEKAKYFLKSGLTDGGGSGIIKTGGKITDSNFWKYEEYEEAAKKYYEKCLQDDSDVLAISTNTDFSVDEVTKIKNHMMKDEHLFEDSTVRKFDPSIDQALAWKRLISGNNIKGSDTLLLNHELEELTYMQRENCTYEEAHEYANKKYDWQKVCGETVDTDEL